MGHGLGWVCLLQDYGSASTVSSLKPSDGTWCLGKPSRTESLKGDSSILTLFHCSFHAFEVVTRREMNTFVSVNHTNML